MGLFSGISGLTGGLLGGSGSGAFNKNAATTNQSTSNDNRQVNDASNGGTVVSGSNNTVTDGGAFGIVSKLVDGVVGVAGAQTVAARDIALGQASQSLAINSAADNQAASFLGLTGNQSTAAMAAAAALAVVLLFKVL